MNRFNETILAFATRVSGFLELKTGNFLTS
jgi:hypothetical protein